ncbi:MAG: BamA/TamA family outer membrane protein [Ignavibacteriae bacterium]|nr:BamA/TamA family outer membrane protein [Ignavibacteriota bacterium]
MSFRGAFATTQARAGLAFTGDFRTLIRGISVLVDASVSQFIHSRFYGFGNESVRDAALDRGKYYRVNHTVSTIQARAQNLVYENVTASVGGFWKKVDLTAEPNSYFSLNTFPGTSSFDYAGVLLEVNADTRDNILAPFNGFYGLLTAAVHPALLDNKKTFTKFDVDLRKYVPFWIAGLRSSLAVRGAGEKVWGSFPLYEAAYLGGSAGLRGFPRERFAGDASISGTIEFRSFLTKLKVGVPLGFGLVAFGESGRVFLSGENSKRWHTSYGGGLWATLLDRMATLNFTVGASSEATRFYIGFGFMF